MVARSATASTGSAFLDACIRSTEQGSTASSTPEGVAELAAWVRKNLAGRAVKEASGGYERSWAEALRAAGVEVLIVDPKRVRSLAKAAGARGGRIDLSPLARRPQGERRGRG